MLVHKNKEKKNKMQKDSCSDESIQSMQSWVRKIEQTTHSVSSRLAAVEKRLSSKSYEPLDVSLSDINDEEPPNILDSDVTKETTKDLEESVKFLDKNFITLSDEFVSQKNLITVLAEKFDRIETAVTENIKEFKQHQNQESQTTHDINTRIVYLEQKEPPKLRIGKMEIPIEVTGVIGGILVFLIAILVVVGEKELIVSPLFLVLVGGVLLVSAMIKTVHINASVVKFLRKKQRIDDQL
ncbi:MAG: hypothetical protein NT038_00480 [Euryarchaeota archaeon]|nr:hypothetical protein [Euryarchaeota archaeon]